MIWRGCGKTNVVCYSRGLLLSDYHFRGEVGMNIKIGLTNHGGYELIAYSFNGGIYPDSSKTSKIMQSEGTGE